MDLLELSQDDYGYDISVTLYKTDDSATAENLTDVSTASLDITRLDETPIVDNAVVTITDAGNGVVTFTPAASWFTSGKLDGRSHYVGIFKLTYSSGVKHSFKMPIFVHLH